MPLGGLRAAPSPRQGAVKDRAVPAAPLPSATLLRLGCTRRRLAMSPEEVALANGSLSSLLRHFSSSTTSPLCTREQTG